MIPSWGDLGDHVDRVLNVMFPTGRPVPHSADCPDHDRCLTAVLCEDVWDTDDPAHYELVLPFVAYWLDRRQAGVN